jgi:hypothetical protein
MRKAFNDSKKDFVGPLLQILLISTAMKISSNTMSDILEEEEEEKEVCGTLAKKRIQVYGKQLLSY